ncbi:MAG TPA: PfkB family carbohydrate kinase [Bryobacteraceae bacterium]|nr:PfkB family carbohydrate kinase [Bryobacteraceae bacterium]
MNPVEDILGAFHRYSALIVGDICLDRWCTYDPHEAEPSRETGIPRIGVVSTAVTPGAGGTVANNLAALGIGRVAVLGAIGDDGFGYELKRALHNLRISSELLVADSSVATFTYMKLLNGGSKKEDHPRVDFINTQDLPSGIEDRILHRLDAVGRDFDVIFVADQAETAKGGVVTNRVRESIVDIARDNPNKVVWVDSRRRSSEFRNVIIKPNQEEADAACTALFRRIDYTALRQHVESKLMFVTEGARGVMVVDESGEHLVPTREVREPIDICGAGDSFSAGAGIALAATGSARTAAWFGNLVASITITKRGTGTASPTEVRAAAEAAGALA